MRRAAGDRAQERVGVVIRELRRPQLGRALIGRNDRLSSLRLRLVARQIGQKLLDLFRISTVMQTRKIAFLPGKSSRAKA